MSLIVTSWIGPVPMNGIATEVVTAQNADGRVEIFYTDRDHILKHNWQTAPDGLLWQGETSFNVTAQQMAVGITADGRLELFFIDLNNLLRHVWQNSPIFTPPAGQSWTFDPNPLSLLSVQSVTVGTDALGRLQIFYLGSDHALYLNRQNQPATAAHAGTLNSWAGETRFWMDSGKAIQLARNADVRLELFLLGTDNRLYHAWQKSASTSLSDPILESWSLSSQLWGQQAKNFAVGHNQDGRLELFYVGKNGGLDHDWQTALPTAANPNTFGQQGQRFGNENAKDLAVALDVNGLQELCYVGSNNGLYFQNQDSPAIAGPGADLNSWVPSYRVNIETDVKAVAMAAQAGGFVDLFYIASDNQLFNIIQIAESELLGSNLNQLLSSECHSLTGVSVVINITQDVVCAVASGSTKGFSFQLNAYSLKGSTCGYQQYVIALFGTELVCGIDNFTPDGKTLAHGIFKMGTLPSAKLAAGSQLRIDLGTDANGNVDTATFSFLNQQGPAIKPVSKNIKSVAGGHSSVLAPIVAFELDVVGPVNSENSILSSGAGTLTYQADQLLSPIDQPWIAGNPPVPCAESQLVTAEWANTTYSRMTAQRANPLSQMFSVVIDAKQAVSHAGHKRPSTRITAEQLKALTG